MAGRKQTGNTKLSANLDRLKKLVKDKQNPWILIYSNPDPDALASAWGLKELLLSFGCDSKIGYTGAIGRLENETMVNLLNIPARKVSENEFYDADMIALVDAQPEFFSDIALPRCDIIFDHHPRKSSKACAFTEIRTRALSASSIITEYLRAANINISKRLATALHYGLQTDSRNLQRSPSKTDTSSAHFLESKIDRSMVRRIEFSSYSLGRLDYFSIALIKLRYANGILYSNIGSVPSGDVCAQTADFLIRVKEAEWAVISGSVNHKLVIVFRCDGYKKSAGTLAEKAFSKFGSAGGHRTMARAEIPEEKLPDNILLTQNEKLDIFILEAMTGVVKAFKPVTRLTTTHQGTL